MAVRARLGFRRGGDHRDPQRRATSLELFFDLTFVFTVTQLTGLLADHPDLRGVAMAVTILMPTWWMYGGYVWLTNAVAPDRLRYRLLLLGGMGGFLVMALAIPTAFEGSGATFAIGYAVVTLLHSALFIYGSSDREAAAMLSLTPFNVVAAALLLVGRGAWRRRAVGAVARGVGARVGHGRLPPAGPGLRDRGGALRRAPRPRDHHRARRVGHRDRDRREGAPGRRVRS